MAGKVALVSGGARGIGAAVVRALLAEGAAVYAGDVTEPAEESGATALHLDVREQASWAAAVERIEREQGALHVLVNNAGVMRRGAIVDQPLEDYLDVVQVNQVGTWLGIKVAAPLIVRSGGGSIVNVSSTGGLRGVGGLAAYCSSKWAIRGLTKTAALELASQNIRVNSVHPGTVGTEMTGIAPDASGAGPWNDFPIARVGRAEEIAEMVLFLASDRSSYSTGAEFVCEGGKLAGSTYSAVLSS